MASVVGQKGQIVIEKEIRNQLGIGPGWRAIQTVVGSHIEIRMLPPEHSRSLKGRLRRSNDDAAKAETVSSDAGAWQEKAAREVGREFKRRHGRREEGA